MCVYQLLEWLRPANVPTNSGKEMMKCLAAQNVWGDAGIFALVQTIGGLGGSGLRVQVMDG